VPVQWAPKLQAQIAISTIEYIAMAHVIRDLIPVIEIFRETYWTCSKTGFTSLIYSLK